MAITEKLKAIADAIREKTGKNGVLTLEQMVTEIEGIQTGSSDVDFPFGGKNAQLVESYHETFKLADTSFVVGTSASTSSTSILASVSNKYVSPSIEFGDKDIVVIQRCVVNPVHGAAATGKAQQIRYALENMTWFSKRKTTDTSGKTTRQSSVANLYLNKYFTTTGTVARAQGNYGFYMTTQTPSVSSATAASATIRCSSPVLYYRASSSYESTANIKTVTDCTFDWYIDIYTVDSMSTPVAKVNEDIDSMLIG